MYRFVTLIISNDLLYEGDMLRLGDLIQKLGNDIIMVVGDTIGDTNGDNIGDVTGDITGNFTGDNIRDIIGDVDYELQLKGVAHDHRKVVDGGLFVCIKGYASDGHDYASGAVSNGAIALVSQKPLSELAIPNDTVRRLTAFLQVRDSRRALAAASQIYCGEPTKHIKLVGVTGTKGKTTTVYMIRSILKAAGVKAGMLGTIENDIGGAISPAGETTPGALELAEYFSQMLARNCSHAAIEVSSQGLALSRVEYCDFDIGVFTNFFRDHISPSEHADEAEYLAAKLKLFAMCKNAVVNADIREYATVGEKFCSSCTDSYYNPGLEAKLADANIAPGHPFQEWNSCGRLLAYSADETNANHEAADVRASRIELVRSPKAGSRFFVETPWFSDTLTVGLPGLYNISNALAAISVCGLLGTPLEAVRKGLRDVEVRGRTQVVDEGQDFTVLVDYAHNAASLEALLMMLHEYGYSRITTVFGCGGGRARERRFEMGEVSGRYSNFTIITSDNPRMENPYSIMADIEIGIRRVDGDYMLMEDRGEAICYAIKNAQQGELVLIAGKGHETTQSFSGRTVPFDDVQTARKYLRKETGLTLK